MEGATEPEKIGSLSIKEGELRARIGHANAQLRYYLQFRELLLSQLNDVLDAQHSRDVQSKRDGTRV